MDLVRRDTDAGALVLRDIVEDDVEPFIAYWHAGGADLDFLGIDRDKLGSEQQTRERFFASIRREGEAQRAVGFAIVVGEKAVGYTNVNLRGRDGYVHVHLTDPSARNLGVVSELLPFALKAFFDVLSIDRLVLEARTRNQRINRVVQKAGLQPDATLYLEQPDGLAGPGDFNVYYIDLDMIDPGIQSETPGS